VQRWSYQFVFCSKIRHCSQQSKENFFQQDGLVSRGVGSRSVKRTWKFHGYPGLPTHFSTDFVDHAYHRSGESTLCVALCDHLRAVTFRICCLIAVNSPISPISLLFAWAPIKNTVPMDPIFQWVSQTNVLQESSQHEQPRQTSSLEDWSKDRLSAMPQPASLGTGSSSGTNSMDITDFTTLGDLNGEHNC